MCVCVCIYMTQLNTHTHTHTHAQTPLMWVFGDRFPCESAVLGKKKVNIICHIIVPKNSHFLVYNTQYPSTACSLQGKKKVLS